MFGPFPHDRRIWRTDQLTYFIGVQKDVSVQVKAQQRLLQLEQQLAEVQAELAALKATSGH